MITEEQWRVFGRYVSPGTNVRLEKDGPDTGILLENYPYRLCALEAIDKPSAQNIAVMREYPSLVYMPYFGNEPSIYYWPLQGTYFWVSYQEEFHTFEEILALGESLPFEQGPDDLSYPSAE